MDELRDDDIIDSGVELIEIDTLKVIGPQNFRIRFKDGVTVDTDLSGLIHKSRFFKPLEDAELCAQVEVIFEGSGVAWPNGLDYSAESLQRLGLFQQEMMAKDFKSWINRLGLSNNEAADALGLTARTVISYKSRKKPLPFAIKLACETMEHDHTMRYARIRPRKPGRPRKQKAA